MTAYYIITALASAATAAFLVWLALRGRGAGEERQRLEALAELSALRERLEARTSQAEELRLRLAGLEKSLAELAESKKDVEVENAGIKAALESERRAFDDKLRLIEESKEKLSDAFKNLANEIFEAKGKNFAELNKTSLEPLLGPLNQKIGDFERKVVESHERGLKDRAELMQKLTQLQELNTHLGREADNLVNALKGNVKSQGSWGEMILEHILEASGLANGREYHTQKSMDADDGGRLQPDVVVSLPEGKSIVVDSKVSLNAYERYCEAADDDEKARLLAEHLASIKKHVKELADKNYQALYQIKSPDFVLMFMPIEPAFSLAASNDRSLFTDTLKKNIVIVTPSTLLATLRTVAYTWKQEYQNRNAMEIAREAGLLYDKFCGFLKDFDEIDRRLEKAREAHADARTKLTGRGGVSVKLENIKKMGASPSKAIPENYLDKDLLDSPSETKAADVDDAPSA